MISDKVLARFGLALLLAPLLFAGAPHAPTPAPAAVPAAPAQEPQLRGRVLGADGNAVKKALVRVAPDEQGTDPAATAGPVRPARPAPLRAARVETAEDGTFAVSGPRDRELVLRVEANGYAPFTEARIPAGATVRVSLKRGFALSGLVRDLASREPLAGATVLACDPGAIRFGEDACRRATTGDAGRFRLADLPRGSVEILARAPARASARLADVTVPQAAPEGKKPQELELYLKPGGRLAGRVVGSDGKPVEGAVLRALSVAEDIRERRRETPAWPVQSDELGRFALEGLPTGRFRLIASKTGLAAAETGPYEIKAGTDLGALEVRLDAGAILRVRLVSPEDRPVRGLDVRLRDPSPGGGDRHGGIQVREDQIREGDDGVYTLSRLPSGTFTLRLLPGDGSEIEKENVQLKAGETTNLGTIVVREGRSVSGRITDAAGTPVAAAQVSSFWREGADFRSRRVESKADGRYRIGGLGEAPLSVIVVRAKGFARAERDGAKPGDRDVDFVLERTGSVTGRVEAAGGVVPAAFRIRAYPEAAESEGSLLRRLEPREEASLGRVFADTSGDFRLDDLDPGTYTLEAAADHFAPARRTGVVVAGEQVADAGTLLLQPGIALRGRVLDARDDSPVAGAALRAEVPQTLPTLRGLAAPALATAVSSTDGAFALDGLSAGAVLVVADHPEFSPSRARVELQEQENPPELLLRISRGGTISGLVLDSQRNPVAGARIVITRGTGEDTATAASDETGRYSAERLAPGSVRVLRQPDDGRGAGQGFRMKSAVVREGEVTIVDFDESSKIRVAGRVLLGETPLPNASLLFRALDPAGAAEIRTAQTDAEGAYRVGLERSGEYQVGVQISGVGGPAGQSSVKIAVPELDEVVQDILLPASFIAGRVFDRDGKGIASASVSAVRDGASPGDPSRRLVAYCDPEGLYRLDGMKPGTYRLSARAAGYRLKEIHPVEISEDHPSTTLDVELERGVRLRGRVLSPQGGGIAGAMVFVAPAGSSDSALFLPAQTDVNGGFEMTAPADGPVDITAISSAWAPTRLSSFTPPQDEAQVVLRASAGGRIRIQVAGSGGQPLSGLQPLLRPIPAFPGSEFAFGGNRRPAPTGADGTTLVGMLAPGLGYEVSLPGRRDVVPVQVAVVEGQEALALLTVP